jgi:hypothetical protein
MTLLLCLSSRTAGSGGGGRGGRRSGRETEEEQGVELQSGMASSFGCGGARC